MAIQPKTLSLVANPWAAIDELGRPSGACPPDPTEDTGRRGFIGATQTAKLVRAGHSRRVAGRSVVQESERHERTWEFDPNPVTLPNTGYYRDRAGKRPYELIAGDKRTAAALGVEFVEPKIIIEETRKLRVAEFDAQHGQGAWQELEDERKAEAAAAAKAAKQEQSAKASATSGEK